LVSDNVSNLLRHYVGDEEDIHDFPDTLEKYDKLIAKRKNK